MRNLHFGLSLILLSALSACNTKPDQNTQKNTDMDVHSFAQPAEAVVKHLDLDIKVDFDTKKISGTASWQIETKDGAKSIVFDTKGLTIEKVTFADGSAAEFSLGKDDEYMGSPLTVHLKPGAKQVNVTYSTSPDAAAVQWLDPQQTADKKYPFLFTQSEAILARSWVPCQDSPGIRFTYNATVQVPKELMALMSASNPTEHSTDGKYTFSQDKAIPSYLMALAVGDLEFKSLGRNTGVYAERSMIEKSAWEFADMQKMMDAAEKIYGKYRWGRYDVIVLPPSFPFGGMENPELTFATPTIIAGDRSLVSLVAHEMAHSWSGNLVTNANWNDFWLNEGFTVYFERRIMEAIEGESYAEMLSLIGFQDLQNTLQQLGPNSDATKLKLDLKGKNPDDGMTDIAYEKGYCLLRTIEEAVGRERFDAFVNKYFNEHAFQSITTETFVDYYKKELIKGDEALAQKINIEKWVYEPGLPDNCPEFTSERFAAVDTALQNMAKGTAPTKLNTNDWSTHEWLHFIRHLPVEMNTEKMASLDKAFGFTKSGNSEILGAWFTSVAHNNYEPGYDAMEEFLVRVGRRKFLTPIYTELSKTANGKEMAKDIYAKARPNYHYVARQTMDGLLK